jgi:predicted dehydrogenase
MNWPEAAPVTALRLGLLGTARISERAVVDPAHLTGTRLVAVAGRDRDRAEVFARRHGIERVVSTYAELVADPEVEAVYNPLPNALHGPWNLAAIAARKHVLSEKPFASNAQEAVAVRDAGERSSVVVADGFHYLYHPVTRRLHELIASGELGDLRRVEVVLVNTPVPLDDPRWSLELGGGALMDLGCYGLHANRVLGPWGGGEPEIAEVRGATHPERPQLDLWVDVELEFPSGATGSARCHMAGEATRLTYRVVGSRGEAFIPNFILPNMDDRLLVRTPDGERVEHLGTRSSYTYQLDAFVAAIRHGTPMPTDAGDAVMTVQMIDACYKALGMEPRPRMTGVDVCHSSV